MRYKQGIRTNTDKEIISNLAKAVEDLSAKEGISRLKALAVLLDGTHRFSKLEMTSEGNSDALEYFLFCMSIHDLHFIPDAWVKFTDN